MKRFYSYFGEAKENIGTVYLSEELRNNKERGPCVRHQGVPPKLEHHQLFKAMVNPQEEVMLCKERITVVWT